MSICGDSGRLREAGRAGDMFGPGLDRCGVVFQLHGDTAQDRASTDYFMPAVKIDRKALNDQLGRRLGRRTGTPASPPPAGSHRVAPSWSVVM
ncbi:hypothetical protein AB0I51_40675 [Streptomyces sp. NPDC050549]|uniref:hypothetical protein n=1 Tax=Streptomyces sp. NPDC050549 TaxID=3155406 RepID=UPI00343536AF